MKRFLGLIVMVVGVCCGADQWCMAPTFNVYGMYYQKLPTGKLVKLDSVMVCYNVTGRYVNYINIGLTCFGDTVVHNAVYKPGGYGQNGSTQIDSFIYSYYNNGYQFGKTVECLTSRVSVRLHRNGFVFKPDSLVYDSVIGQINCGYIYGTDTTTHSTTSNKITARVNVDNVKSKYPDFCYDILGRKIEGIKRGHVYISDVSKKIIVR